MSNPVRKIMGGDFFYKKVSKFDPERGELVEYHYPVPLRGLGVKNAVSPEEAYNIAASPFLSYEEKVQKLKEMGASDSLIRIAFQRTRDSGRRVRVRGRMR